MSANHCPYCGAPISFDSKFCSNCGKELDDSTRIIPSQDPLHPQQSSAPQTPQGYYQPQPAPTQMPPSNSNRNTLLVVLSIIVGILLSVVGFIGIRYFTTEKEEPAKTDTVLSRTDTVYQTIVTQQPTQPVPPKTTLIDGGTYTYTGTVAGQRVSMVLTNERGYISGSYRYTKFTSDNRLALTGTLAGKRLSLYEINEEGEYTGELTTTVVGGKITGKFVNLSSGKSYNINLTQE